ncbi:hypothetical protein CAUPRSCDRAFT_11824 [Caulochytrium protostelioides]|uniref:UBA domain-containing protein n=1 Tax=Caulochytrium protostelioides TaxID=1555241 RepID=A0A4P9WTG1_9FUNG|nr:hypothetical protein CAUPRSCDRAFT_11824 [Caulochytrium protostelioides]
MAGLSPDDDHIFAGSLKTMAAMGMTDREQNIRALHKAGGRIYLAIDLVCNGTVDDDDAVAKAGRRTTARDVMNPEHPFTACRIVGGPGMRYHGRCGLRGGFWSLDEPGDHI